MDSISVVFEFHCGGWEVGGEERKQENKFQKKKKKKRLPEEAKKGKNRAELFWKVFMKEISTTCINYDT